MNFAVVPAAGRGRRMGRPKLALPLGARTVVEHVVAALRDGGVETVVVVVGPHAPELAPLAEAAGAHVCRLPHQTAEMRATVEYGLRWLEERCRPRPDDAWLLAPGDCPAFDAGVVRTLIDVFAARPSASVVVPVYGGRRGHPVLIAWRHVAGIRAHPAGKGLDTYLRTHAPDTLEVQAASAAVLWDLDTPEDYERLRRDAGRDRTPPDASPAAAPPQAPDHRNPDAPP
jgi:CTP:molybdopterin cytidylyltransferase MocA